MRTPRLRLLVATGVLLLIGVVALVLVYVSPDLLRATIGDGLEDIAGDPREERRTTPPTNERPTPTSRPPATSPPPSERPGARPDVSSESPSAEPPSAPAPPPRPGPPVPPSRPPLSADVVADFIRRMVPASVAYVVPESLTRGRPGLVTLRIGPAAMSPKDVEATLRAEFGGAGRSDSAAIRISSRMSATLTADQPCEIVLSTPPADRAVAFTQGATWRWAVTPTRATGEVLDLTVALTAPVLVDGVETSYSVGVYRKQLRVQVTYWDSMADTMAWAAASWAPLAALATGGAALYTWLRRRARRVERRPGFR